MANHAEEIVASLVATGKWSAIAARRALRANFQCEYCDRDLLASVDSYKMWEEDHIVPLSAGGSNEDSNIAIACRVCNYHAKRGWNPQNECGPSASREILIAAVREYVHGRIQRFSEEVTHFQAIVYGISS